MVRSRHLLIAIGCITVLRLEGSVPAVAYERVSESAEDGVTSAVEPVGVPATAFAGGELRLRFVCHKELQLAWQASAARRPFASGVIVAKEGQAEICFRTPDVKEGVALPIQVAVKDAVCKILVFGKDPLEGRRQWAEQLQIVLFDPPGKTAKAFDQIALAYRQVAAIGALDAVSEGIVVVGEGLVLDEHRGLSGVLCQVARKGVAVLLLVPQSGQLTISDPAPERFELQGSDVGEQIDSRTVADLTRSHGYRIAGEGNGPTLRITDQPSDYAWGDFRYDDARGRLCCLGWSLLDQWETSPAPRFFLVRVLEVVSSGNDLSGVKKHD